MKRIFIAIKASPAIQRKAEIWRDRYNALPVRWMPKDNLHITLIPPWDEAGVDRIVRKVESLRSSIAPFDVRFHKVTFGPTLDNPWLIRAEGRAVESLVRLQKELIKELKTGELTCLSGPHMTLARFRPSEFALFPMKKLYSRIAWTETVDSICVMESILKPEGTEYKVLKNIPLTI